MHGFEGHDDKPASSGDVSSGPWFTELNRYHWFVLIVAALGWLFDTMDQQLFALARRPAMMELLSVKEKQPDGTIKVIPPANDKLGEYAGYTTSIFLMGWALGGLSFGVLGDRIGRARVMLWTILLYSVCTGLSALSWDFQSFAFFRFITGLGVGGEFAVGVSLVAEVMPHRARPFALGLLQALSAIGNITAALINMGLGMIPDDINGEGVADWRIMFVIGAVPALLALLVRRNLKEPERWQATAVSDDKKQLGSYSEMFGHPVWSRHALLGMILGFAGVVGLWGIGFFSFDLLSSVLRKQFVAQGMDPAEIAKQIPWWVGITSIMQNLGAFFGIYAFSYLTHGIGRKASFAITLVLAMGSTILVFGWLNQFRDIFWMVPLMGFCQLALFGGYAIYFPELFPTRLRSTGTSFCYNVGRFVAAVGPLCFGMLVSRVFSEANGYKEGMREAGMAMSCVFLLGLFVLPFLPETKGKPLPE